MKLSTVVFLAAGLITPLFAGSTRAALQSEQRITLPDDHVFTDAGRQVIAISPDGSQVAYAANGQLFLKPAGNAPAAVVRGTQNQQVINPVFSPDGSAIAFWSGLDQTIKRIPVSGGEAVAVTKAQNVFGMSWGPEGHIVFGQALQGVMRVAAEGGKPETIVTMKPNEAAHGPQILPGGAAVLYTMITLPPSGANPWDNAQIVAQPLGGERKIVVDKGSDARYLPTGHIVYARAGTLYAAPFDLKRLETTGAPAAVTEDVRAAFSTGTSQIAVSNTGTLAYIPGLQPSYRVSLVDRAGNRKDLGSLPGSAFAPRISPDGRQLAWDALQGSDIAVWIADFPSLTSRRRLPSPGKYPLWSADGRRVFFIAAHDGQEALFWQAADGSGTPELLALTARAPEHWSAKTQSLTYITLTNADYDVWQYSFVDKKASPLVQIPKSSQHSSRVSPDERRIAYASDESGRFEVYVQPLPPAGAAFRVTTGGGEHPVWSPDGTELYFDRGGRLFTTSIRTDPVFNAAAPVELPIAGFIQGPGRRQWDITSDGKQFVMLFPSPEEIRIIPNWFDDLRRRTQEK